MDKIQNNRQADSKVALNPQQNRKSRNAFWHKTNDKNTFNRVDPLLILLQQASELSQTYTETQSTKSRAKNFRQSNDLHSRIMIKLKSLIETLPQLQPEQEVTSDRKITILTQKRDQLLSKQFTPVFGDQEFPQILGNQRYKQQQPTKRDIELKLQQYTQYVKENSKVKQFSQFILDQIAKKPNKSQVQLCVPQLPEPKKSSIKLYHFYDSNNKLDCSINDDLNHDLRESKSFYKEEVVSKGHKPTPQRFSRTVSQIKQENQFEKTQQASNHNTGENRNMYCSDTTLLQKTVYDVNVDLRDDEITNKFISMTKTIVSKIHHTSPTPSPQPNIKLSSNMVPPLIIFQDKQISKQMNKAEKVSRKTVTLKDQSSSRLDHSAISMLTNRYNKQKLSQIFQQLKSPVLPKILTKQPSNFHVVQIPSNANLDRYSTELGTYQSQKLSRKYIMNSNPCLMQTSSRDQFMIPHAIKLSKVQVSPQKETGGNFIESSTSPRSTVRSLKRGLTMASMSLQSPQSRKNQ